MTTLIWRGYKLGELSEDLTLEDMALLMLAENREQAIRDAVHFYLVTWAGEEESFFRNVIDGSFSEVRTEYYIADMLEDAIYAPGIRDEIGLEVRE